jgi:hypothetical protein
MRRPLVLALSLVAVGAVLVAGLIVARDRASSPGPAPSQASSPASTSAATGTRECDVSVPDGGDIQAAAEAASEGSVVCLTGTYRVAAPIHAKDGQSFVGPASITGTTHTGFELKGAESGLDVTAVDVTLVDLDISGFALRAVECWTGTTIRGGRLHHNGRNGVGCGLEYELGHVLIEGVEVDHNGSEGELGRGGGGLKFARLGPDGLTVRDSFIHDNVGNGVWCDVQCIGTFLIERNTISGNWRKGVHYEKSGASDEFREGEVVEGRAIVRNNVVTGNGTEGRAHAADGGIVGVSSRNMLIEGNTTADNHRAGIVLETDGRLSGAKHGWPIGAIVRHDDADDGIMGCDEAGVECSGAD